MYSAQIAIKTQHASMVNTEYHINLPWAQAQITSPYSPLFSNVIHQNHTMGPFIHIKEFRIQTWLIINLGRKQL